MMEMERRGEPKRMNIEKRVALFVPGKKKPYQGVTRNMSDAGICAGFKKLPKNGEDVVLHVYWQEDKPPIEQPASLVWTSPNMPDGIVRVGLQLKDEPVGQSVPQPPETEDIGSVKVESSPQPILTSHPVIEQGAAVRLLVGGVTIETVAASIGSICEDNTVHIVLEIVDPAFGGSAASSETGDVPPEEQDWTPHPFRDAWRTAKKTLGPAAIVLARIARTTIQITAKIAVPLLCKLKSKLPKKLSS